LAIDKELLEKYAAAVRVRPVIKFLPDGLRQWAGQYEEACFQDLREQSGNNITEAELLAMARPIIWTVLWPVVKPLVIDFIKKRWQTIAVSGAGGLSLAGIAAAIYSYLTK